MVTSTLTDRITTFRQRRTAPLILELDLSDGIAEEPPTDPLSALAAMRRPRLADVLDGLRRARTDDRVRALVAKVGGQRMGLAQVQELRAAISAFAGTGKLTVAWAETFGDFSPGNVPYYLATAFDRIYLQPSGDLGLTGISVQNWFYRGALDKLGVEFQVGKREEYKSAAERLTEQGFSGPAREALQRMAASIVEQLTEAIAQRLEISAEDGPGADRPRPVRGQRGAGHPPGGRARLPGRGLRGGPEGGRARTRTCCTWAATSGPGRWPSGPGSCPARPRTPSR